jgi:hypothetical protein
MRKKFKKIALFNGGLKHIGFVNISRNSQFCSNIFRTLLDLNKEYLNSVHIKYSDNTMREES